MLWHRGPCEDSFKDKASGQCMRQFGVPVRFLLKQTHLEIFGAASEHNDGHFLANVCLESGRVTNLEACNSAIENGGYCY